MKYGIATIYKGKESKWKWRIELDDEDREFRADNPILDFGYSGSMWFPKSMTSAKAFSNLKKRMVNNRREAASRLLAEADMISKLKFRERSIP